MFARIKVRLRRAGCFTSDDVTSCVSSCLDKCNFLGGRYKQNSDYSRSQRRSKRRRFHTVRKYSTNIIFDQANSNAVSDLTSFNNTHLIIHLMQCAQNVMLLSGVKSSSTIE
jgi:hypothetical protein